MKIQTKIENKSYIKIRVIYFILPISIFFIFSCNSSKKLLPNQYILDKIDVVNVKATNLPKENFEAFYRQKPNRKFLRKIDFYVWWYNLFDEQKINQKKINRNLSYEQKNINTYLHFEKLNAKRLKKGKKPKAPTLKDPEKPILLESIRNIGEPAIILDSSLIVQTRVQISKYLFSKGFLNNEVRDSIYVKGKSKRASVIFNLIPKKVYTVKNINYKMDDLNLGALILSDSSNCLLKRGMNYDTEALLIERRRITELALNNGYYFFESAYLNFDVDSNYNNHCLSITIHLKQFEKSSEGNLDSTIYVNHSRYLLDNVYIITESIIGNVLEAPFKDSIKSRLNEFIFLTNDNLAYKQSLFLNNINVYKGQWFRKDSAEQTYKQLLSLGVFKNVTIQFFLNNKTLHGLDCYIVCSPMIKQSITSQLEGTNTSGNIGIDGSVVYQNRNFFKAGELLELKLEGNIIAQTQFNSDNTTDNSINQLQKKFNTIQFGPELTFSIPRAFFPFSLLKFKKSVMPQTFIKTSLNYQSSPKFNRVITDINYGFYFKTHQKQIKHELVPIEIYFVNATLSNEFINKLITLKDAFLLNSFQNHITTLTKYVFNFNSKENANINKKASYYLRLNIQSSGSILRATYKLSGAKSDSLGRYLIDNIPFAQFIKTDLDFRSHIPITKKTWLVYRIAAGIGKPLSNLNVLPYEQSFFSGGPNSIRAWRARTLGPGGYDPSGNTSQFDKIGDLLMEGNVEFRFPMFASFNGAFFIDAGNIWRMQPDINKKDGEFLLNKFADQIAIGAGFGLRWDLTFFVIRLDLAVPLKDPKLIAGDRWTFDKKPLNYSVLNFGIGYPF